MHFVPPLILVTALPLLLGCGRIGFENREGTPGGPCDAVDCGPQGVCTVVADEPLCTCVTGYRNQGPTECVPATTRACTEDNDCDDDNPCTDDSCADGRLCVSTNNDDSCDDGDDCSVTDACALGVCTPGASTRDVDNDGFVDALCRDGEDCNDGEASVHPDAIEDLRVEESCRDGRDNNCDGLTDQQATACPGFRFRSVGGATTDLNVAGLTMTIAATEAVFSGALPDNIGIGDAVQYQTGTDFHLAFVYARTGADRLQLRDASDAAPTPCPPATAARIYRAYNSLSEWQSLAENPAIDGSVRGGNLDRDLVGADVALIVACYADQPEVGHVDVRSWLASPRNFVKIVTPIEPWEVGRSQRHDGTFGGYQLTGDFAGTVIRDRIGPLHVVGLSIRAFAPCPLHCPVVRTGQDLLSSPLDLRVSHCVLDGNDPDDGNGVLHFDMAEASLSGTIHAFNNIIYNAPRAWNEGIFIDNDIGSSVHFIIDNNSVTNVYRGIGACHGEGELTARNNVVAGNEADFWDCNQPMYSSFGGDSGHNVSSDGSSAAVGSSSITGADPAAVFESVTSGAEDLHLASGSVCIRAGTDLRTDPTAPVRDDIDGTPRPDPPDVGADQRSP